MEQASEGIYLSVVVPVYNEEENIPELLRRLVGSVRSIGKPAEIIFVDDGSSDRSLELLTEFRSPTVDVVVVELSRNYGQHAAVMAGFSRCRGEIIVTLDADLQNPPEEVPQLVGRMAEGYDVVGTVRKHRDDPVMRRVASRIVNSMVGRATGHDMHDYGCMLRAYSREIVAAMLACPEGRTFIPALAMTFARRSTEIEVDHAPRGKGKSKYNVWRLVKLNLDLMMGFTSIPLRMLSGTGFVIAAIGLLFSLFLMLRRLFVGPEVEGVFTLFAILYFFVGVQIMALGLLGEYLARMHEEIRHRPRYLVRSVSSTGGEQQ